MKKRVFAVIFLLLGAFVTPLFAQLDLEQEVLVIPDTHNEKPYIWNVALNPKGYELIMDHSGLSAGAEATISFEVRQSLPENIREMHVFIADSDLHMYRHLRPERSGGKYVFSFVPPKPESYRFEVVFRTDARWINLRKDIRIKGGNAGQSDSKKDDGYGVKVKLIPRKVYAEHVVTFLFELSYEGYPLRNLAKMDGADMQLASWDEDLKEFIYVVPKQNLGGHEVALSAVFMRPGRRAVFAEFKHNGALHPVELVIDVLQEPKEGSSVESMKPAD